MSQPCRALGPLHPGDLAQLEVMLDTLAALKDPRSTADLSILLGQKLVASVRALQAQLAQARRREDAAWALLEADLTLPSSDA